jgi:hypothetical protein
MCARARAVINQRALQMSADNKRVIVTNENNALISSKGRLVREPKTLDVLIHSHRKK